MPRTFFKSVKESVMASSAPGRDPSPRQTVFLDSQRDAPRADEARGQSSEVFRTEEARTPPTESPVSSGQVLSVIGPSLVFRGHLVADEDLLIQGRIEGSIDHSGANLTIGMHGEVHADIVAGKVLVQGAVEGDVRASDVISVEASARVQGNLCAPRIGLKEGARFKGAIEMGAPPAGDAASRVSRTQDDTDARSGIEVDHLLEQSS